MGLLSAFGRLGAIIAQIVNGRLETNVVSLMVVTSLFMLLGCALAICLPHNLEHQAAVTRLTSSSSHSSSRLIKDDDDAVDDDVVLVNLNSHRNSSDGCGSSSGSSSSSNTSSSTKNPMINTQSKR